MLSHLGVECNVVTPPGSYAARRVPVDRLCRRQSPSIDSPRIESSLCRISP
jgi:hypothetical protein